MANAVAAVATAAERGKKCRPRDIADLAWSLATCAVRDPPLMASLTEIVGKTFDAWPPKSLAAMFWSCATLQFKDQMQLEAMAHRFKDTIQSAGPKDLASTVWSLATLRL